MQGWLMSFTSFAYLVYVAAACVLYYVLPKKFQWMILLVFSYVFYALAGVKLLGFLLFTTLTTWLAGLAIAAEQEHERKSSEFTRKSSQDKSNRGRSALHRQHEIIALVFIANFGVLFVLKYLNFTIDILNPLIRTISGSDVQHVNWALPLGISFYTFQSLGYVMDVYWKRTEPERNLFRYMLFVSFFPQILQGPIGRHSRLAGQFREKHVFDLVRIEHALQRIAWGYFMKFVIADRAGTAVNQISSSYADYHGFTMVWYILLYSAQLYGDFSGGMDVVIGTAELFGITLDENFKRPYFAVTISDFWHRWHITLGTWMKDYLFYPISLSHWMMRLGKKTRKKFGRKIGSVLPVALANIIVFLAVGMWHGPGIKYLVYGLYNGILIAVEELLQLYTKEWRKKHPGTPSVALQRTRHVLHILLTFFLVNVSWYFDVPADFHASIVCIGNTFRGFTLRTLTDGSLLQLGINQKGYVGLAFGLSVLFIKSVLEENGHDVRAGLDRMVLPVRWFVYLGLIFATLLLGQYSTAGFIYANF